MPILFLGRVFSIFFFERFLATPIYTDAKLPLVFAVLLWPASGVTAGVCENNAAGACVRGYDVGVL